MTEKEFEVECKKVLNVSNIKVELAKFLKENNLEIRSSSKLDKSDFVHNFVEIYYDFYKDGDPVLIYSTEHKKGFGNKIVYEDLLK